MSHSSISVTGSVRREDGTIGPDFRSIPTLTTLVRGGAEAARQKVQVDRKLYEGLGGCQKPTLIGHNLTPANVKCALALETMNPGLEGQILGLS